MSPSDKLKNESVKKNGGARPGAGRPKGGQNKATLERAAVKAAFIALVQEHAEDLFRAQYKLAIGTESRPADNKAIDSLLDRAFGKADSNLDLTTGGDKLNVQVLHYADDSATPQL